MGNLNQTLRDEYLNLREKVFNEIKRALIDLGSNVTIPYNISDICCTCIAYNGGNHPEYDSDVFSEVEKITLTKANDIEIHFSNGGVQELTENSIDDYFTILDLLVVIKKKYLHISN